MKTKLEKSHSKLSNFILTMLMFLVIISITFVFSFIGLKLYGYNVTIYLIISACLLVFSLVGVKSFKR